MPAVAGFPMSDSVNWMLINSSPRVFRCSAIVWRLREDTAWALLWRSDDFLKLSGASSLRRRTRMYWGPWRPLARKGFNLMVVPPITSSAASLSQSYACPHPSNATNKE